MDYSIESFCFFFLPSYFFVFFFFPTSITSSTTLLLLLFIFKGAIESSLSFLSCFDSSALDLWFFKLSLLWFFELLMCFCFSLTFFLLSTCFCCYNFFYPLLLPLCYLPKPESLVLPLAAHELEASAFELSFVIFLLLILLLNAGELSLPDGLSPANLLFFVLLLFSILRLG